LLSGCGGTDKSVTPGSALAAPHSATRNVGVFQVKPSEAAGDQLIPAVLSVENTAMVLAQRDGILIELRGEEGARVEKGQVIARLNDDEQRAQLRQAELEVNRSMQEERQLEALVKVNHSELDQEHTLAEDGLSSKRQVDRAQFRLDANQHELERVRLATQSAAAKVDVVKIEIEKATIRVPFTGIITRRYMKLGTSVVKNDKLFEVSQLEPLEVRFQLPHTEGGRLSVGRIVSLSLAENDRVVAQARIRRLDPIADAASNTRGYWADVIGKVNLIPGVAVNVHVPNTAPVSTFWVPRSVFAATSDLRSGAATLLVVEGDRCSARTVWVSTVEGSRVEIGSGLNSGDRVIVAPPADLRAGELVTAKQ
jgi:RND family efflux transporter MFP subunit